MKIRSDFGDSGGVKTLFRALDFACEANTANIDRSPRAVNMTALAQEVGMSRVGLNKALSGQGNPTLATVLKVTKALGLKVSIQPEV
ncbi:addiction module antidote protein [Sulfitobacter sp.]|uniref:addiction module antidote protein n=1 Tax=Sulfitobacter sp. TaxID=1903071 RepID=UPI003F6A8AB9